jgi:hypothetical protein
MFGVVGEKEWSFVLTNELELDNISPLSDGTQQTQQTQQSQQTTLVSTSTQSINV